MATSAARDPARRAGRPVERVFQLTYPGVPQPSIPVSVSIPNAAS
jgi:hypothetical protein